MTDNSINLPDHVTCSIQWADAVVLVYSTTDRRSFDLIEQLHQQVVHTGGATMPPVILLANKADLLHLRRVDSQQGSLLASTLGCSFYEVSASEDYSQVHKAFHRLCCQLAKQQPAAPPTPAAANATEKRRSLLIPRPKSPNMQDLKRRFKQALSAKVRTVTSV
ncbi:ras-like protein family member 11B [Anarrhichthys ocellatus]|uniref:ras-like protein family member 11B n=1 Tax=Anarrhichthys ocellatus TaxID=433405 RepID=UPI0012ECCEA0|nr:ras-like protein family member 11B [Anarrhichthys ocellatus]